MRSKRDKLVATLLAMLIVAPVVVGCGSDDEDKGAAAIETDGAFLVEMTTHHEAAIEMAELAQEKAEHVEVRDLANEIVESQSEEIELMKQIHARLFEGSFEEADHGSLGLADHETGMDGAATQLENAQPFDRAFIDSMIPHHQGAILMARTVLESGSDPEVAMLANEIIEAQSREIEEMNSWREEWYGEPSPAGGVPEEEDGAAPHEEMGHT